MKLGAASRHSVKGKGWTSAKTTAGMVRLAINSTRAMGNRSDKGSLAGRFILEEYERRRKDYSGEWLYFG